MNILISDVREAAQISLSHTNNLAIKRLKRCNIDELCKEYIGPVATLCVGATVPNPPVFYSSVIIISWRAKFTSARPGVEVDVLDPGTAKTLLTLTALMLGRDVGPLGLGTAWRLVNNGAAYELNTLDGVVYFTHRPNGAGSPSYPCDIHAPEVVCSESTTHSIPTAFMLVLNNIRNKSC